jgi:ribosome assembly protein 3
MVDTDSASSSSSKVQPSSTAASSSNAAKSKTAPLSSRDVDDDFTAIYLRKVTSELGDDLIKVREAQDFKTSSLPMLIHALKQGQSMYASDEKRRVVGAATG